MKNILTIDFDIIMEPTIELYNDMVPSKSWEELLKYSQMQSLNFNVEHYEKLTVLIQLLANNPNVQIFFIDNHDRLLNYLPKNE